MSDTTQQPEACETRAGYVAICGRPNVGKSTLLNFLVGEKLAIVTPKPQTTRNRILGVAERGSAQMILIDSPGVHDAKQAFNEFMVDQARDAARGADVVVFVVDATEFPQPADHLCADMLAGLGKPIVLAINKMDALTHQPVETVIEQYKLLGDFAHGVPISATVGMNVDVLLDDVAELLPPGPWLYPEGTLTDVPIKFQISELVREQILNLAREEVPYAVAVLVDEMGEREDGTTYIRAVIHVERDSQKGIVIGQRGQMLKQIGKAARAEIEELLETKVYLDLWVKVTKNWRKKEHLLQRLGYDVKPKHGN